MGHHPAARNDRPPRASHLAALAVFNIAMTDMLHIDGKVYLPLGSAGELYGFGEGELNALASEGHIRLKKMGKKVYVELSSLQTYLNPAAVPDQVEVEPDTEILTPIAMQELVVPPTRAVARPIRPPILHKKPTQRHHSILPYFAYAFAAMLFLVVFVGSGYVAITRYGPGTVDSSYIAAVGVTGEQSFGDYFRSFLRNLFGIKEPQPVLDWPEITEKPRPAPPPVTIQRPASSTPTSAPPQTSRPAATAPRQSAAAAMVFVRIMQRPSAPPSQTLSSGITETYLEGKLTELRNTLTPRSSFNTQVGATHSSLENAISGLNDEFSTAALTVTGDSSLHGALSVSSSATSTFSNGIEIAAGCFSVNGTCLSSGSGSVGSGSATNLAFYAAGGTTLTATSTLSLTLAGNFGVGTTSPFRKFSVTDTVAAAQFALSYDTSRVTQFQTDASGDLVIDPSGGDVLVSDDNLLVCDNGCGTSPSGAGTISAENKLGVGTTTPAYKVSIETNDGTTDFLQIASTTAQSLLVFKADGKLGIGTSTPFHKLSLGSGGAIVTTEFGLTDAATIAVDWSRGNQQYVTLGGNRTLTFSNYLGGQILRLFVCQDSTGSRTVTWPSVMVWEGGSAPTLTTTANQCDIVNLVASVATSSSLKVYGAAVLAF